MTELQQILSEIQDINKTIATIYVMVNRIDQETQRVRREEEEKSNRGLRV